MNGRNVLRFTQVIHTVLQSGMNLGQAMEMIQKMNGVPQKVVRASCQIKTSLEQGRLFSNALRIMWHLLPLRKKAVLCR